MGEVADAVVIDNPVNATARTHFARISEIDLVGIDSNRLCVMDDCRTTTDSCVVQISSADLTEIKESTDPAGRIGKICDTRQVR